MQEKNIYGLFRVSVILKGVNAGIEIIGGLLLYAISTSTMTAWVDRLTQEELFQDPNDRIAHFFLTSAQHISFDGKSFAAFYLLSHGIIKILLVVGLLRNKLWAYPTSLVVLTGFIAYQLYRFSHTHALGLIALTIFDLVVIVLIWHEYQRVRHNQSFTE